MMVLVLAFVTIVEDAPEALANYLKVTDPLLKRAGAKILQRFSINDVVIGRAPAKTVIIVEYPNRDAVASGFGSDEYASVRVFRDKAFSSYVITVVDTPSDPLASQNLSG